MSAAKPRGELRSVSIRPERGRAYVAVRWRGEIRVTSVPHRIRSLACIDCFGSDAVRDHLLEMETAVVGGPCAIAESNKLAWDGFR